MIKHEELTPGFYRYARPDWTHSVGVSVTEEDGETFVRFYEGTHPIRLRDIPVDATFTGRMENEC